MESETHQRIKYVSYYVKKRLQNHGFHLNLKIKLVGNEDITFSLWRI